MVRISPGAARTVCNQRFPGVRLQADELSRLPLPCAVNFTVTDMDLMPCIWTLTNLLKSKMGEKSPCEHLTLYV